MPGDNPLETARVIAGELPALPHLAELPDRGPGADMIGRAAALLVDMPTEITPRGWHIAERPGRDLRRARSYLSADLDVTEEALDGYEGPLKLQVAGPWTLAATMEQPRSLNPALADPGLVADLAVSLAEGLAAHVADVARRVPGATIIVQLDEPSLSAVAAGAIPTASGISRVRVPDEEILRERLRQVTSATTGYTVVHSCSRDVAFGVIRGAGADGLSLDISQLRTSELDDFGEAAEAGLGLLLGFTDRPSAADRGDRGPGDRGGPPSREDSTPAARRTADAVAGLWRKLTLPPAQLTRQVVVTPSCGLAGYSPAQARDELRRCAEAARILPEMMGD
jgi:methionine synthase II (cobalamin-independent)